jgi:hypothetical protein
MKLALAVLPLLLLFGCADADLGVEQAAIAFHAVQDIAVAVQDTATYATHGGGRGFLVRFRITNNGAANASNVALDSVATATRNDGENLGQNTYGYGVIGSLGVGQSTTYVVSCPGDNGYVCTHTSLRATNPAGDDYPANDFASATP